MALGETVLVPLTNPASVAGLIRLAALLARPDGGMVVPVTVTPPGASEATRGEAHRLVLEAEATARTHEVEAFGVVVSDATVPDGVVEAIEDRGASFVLMGWQGRSTHQNVFGALIDSIVGRSSVPLGVVRLGARPPARILLPISQDHLLPGGSRGVALAAGIIRRLVVGLGTPVLVLRTGGGEAPLPGEVSILSDRIHHDPRAVDHAVGAAARPDDLVVVPVAPTASGLRSATTHVAWAAEEPTLLVAVDVGPVPTRGIADAVGKAGGPAPAGEPPEPPEGPQVVTVEVLKATQERLYDVNDLVSVLGGVGAVSGVREAEGGAVRATVQVAAAGPNAALALVMAALDEAPGFRGAQIRYHQGTGEDDA